MGSQLSDVKLLSSSWAATYLTRVQRSVLSHSAVSFKLPRCKNVLRVRRSSYAFELVRLCSCAQPSESPIWQINLKYILSFAFKQNYSFLSYLPSSFPFPSYSRKSRAFLPRNPAHDHPISMGNILTACFLFTLIVPSFSLPFSFRSSVENGNNLSASVSTGIVIAICMSYPLSCTLLR
jgi:hypothetical protein